MRGRLPVISAASRFGGKTICGTTSSSTLKTSLLSVLSAAKVSVRPGHWPCIKSFTWMGQPTSAQCVVRALVKDQTWRPTSRLMQNPRQNLPALTVKKCSRETVIWDGISWHTWIRVQWNIFNHHWSQLLQQLLQLNISNSFLQLILCPEIYQVCWASATETWVALVKLSLLSIQVACQIHLLSWKIYQLNSLIYQALAFHSGLLIYWKKKNG